MITCFPLSTIHQRQLLGVTLHRQPDKTSFAKQSNSEADVSVGQDRGSRSGHFLLNATHDSGEVRHFSQGHQIGDPVY